MKIILYRDGAAGVVAKLPGDEPMEELGELLGGETLMRPVNGRLMLAVRAAVNEAPGTYELHKVGRLPERISEPFAVVGMGVEGRIRDISVQDLGAVECLIRRA